MPRIVGTNTGTTASNVKAFAVQSAPYHAIPSVTDSDGAFDFTVNDDELAEVVAQLDALAPDVEYTISLSQQIGNPASVVRARLATTGNHALSGLAAIDGVTPSAGDVVLARLQTTGAEKGLYVTAAGAWARTGDSIVPNMEVVIAEGTLGRDTRWTLTTNGPITVGTTPLTFAKSAEAPADMTVSSTAATNQTTAAAKLLASTPAAKSATLVHAGVAATAANNFVGPFTSPDVPRNLRVVMGSGYDGGDVLVTGTDQFDAVVSETFTGGSGVTRTGTKVFKTITAVAKTTVGASSATASVGTGDKIGILAAVSGTVGQLFCDGVFEAVTVDATYSAFTPTTVPDGAKVFLLTCNLLHGHTQDTHTHTLS